MMETLYRGGQSSNDLFERDQQHTQHNEGAYSPLETLVRQTSLKGGWRVRGAAPPSSGTLGVPYSSGKSRSRAPAPVAPAPLEPEDDEDDDIYSYYSQNDSDLNDSDLAPDTYLGHNLPEHQQQHSLAQGSRQPPSSPLLHTQFRQSTDTSFTDIRNESSVVGGDSIADISLDASTSTYLGGSVNPPPPIAPLRLPTRLTIDDSMIDNVHEQFQWDSDELESPTDGPEGRSSSSVRGILPPSFRFPENDMSRASTDMKAGGRPLSDRSLVLPPSVKGLSIRNKAAGPSGGLNANGAMNGASSPVSPGQMSFYSESSYSHTSSKPPPSAHSHPQHLHSASFLPSPGSSRPASTSPVPPTPLSATNEPASRLSVSARSEASASEASVYDDTPEYHHYSNFQSDPGPSSGSRDSGEYS